MSAILVTAFPTQANALCATPGKDASPNIGGIINSYYKGTTPTLSPGQTSINVTGPAAGGSATPIAAGDLLLIIQMQDANINNVNGINYGSGLGSGSGSNLPRSTGLYEYVMATGPVAAGAVPISGIGGGGVTNTYHFAAAGAQGQRTYQVIRVPQYQNATVTSTLTCKAWDGITGGVFAMDVAYNLNMNGMAVSVDGLGFQGGGAQVVAGGGAQCPAALATDYRDPFVNNFFGVKGEGIAGLPARTYRLGAAGMTSNNAGADGYPGGDRGRGAPGNAGGAGNDDNPCAANNQNAGGGGGGNGGPGGGGGNTWSGNTALGGVGGAAFAPLSSQVVMGGGGGAGNRNDPDNANPAPGPYNDAGVIEGSGAPGGGIILIRTGSVSGTGTISADGGQGYDNENDGGGGGGAGGSIVLLALNNSGILNLNLSAVGGEGGDAWVNDPAIPSVADRHGPGGGGGRRIYLFFRFCGFNGRFWGTPWLNDQWRRR